ncbi:MAG: capsular biosynthesis protein [Bacteroidales bacterium]|nr:capsular biosynthesis protein [Bacteroidales bacterium]
MGFLGLFKKKYAFDDGVLQGAVDSHSHILFGVDDGISTLEDSLGVLSFLESVGIRHVWCTPHIMDDLATPTEMLKTRFQELQQAYTGKIELHLAAEYMLDSEFEKRLEQRDILMIDDDMVLVETSMNVPPFNFKDLIRRMMSMGYRPLLAHPERYRYLALNDYQELRTLGVYFQLNLPSLVGYYGETARKKALQLLKNGLYNRVGSDCHRLHAIRDQYSREDLTTEINEQLKQLL